MDQNSNTHESTGIIRRNRYSIGSLGWLLIGAGIIIGFDQYTKHLVVDQIPLLGTWLPDSLSHLSDLFRIVHWQNSGAAFGIFQSGNIIFLIFGIAASGFILLLYPTIDRQESALKLAMIFQLGGAVGNLIDRVRFGYVIDFISILNLPVFNIADASITIGVAILILDVFWAERKAETTKNSPPQVQTTLSGENER